MKFKQFVLLPLYVKEGLAYVEGKESEVCKKAASGVYIAVPRQKFEEFCYRPCLARSTFVVKKV